MLGSSDVRKLCFGTLYLRIEITLQLHFVFGCYSEVFLLHHNYVIYLCNAITSFYDVRITLYFGKFKLRTEIAL